MDQFSTAMRKEQPPAGLRVSGIGVVIIGRNEGSRLNTCFDSLPDGAAVVYVDSGSSDGSVELARNRQIDAIELDPSTPFTAARGRNAGFLRLLHLFPNIQYVQFVDGDCQLHPQWTNIASAFLEVRPNVAAVCGRLRERNPNGSIYNWLCDKEWDRPTGEALACAGNVMMRASALKSTGGYREDLIAAEEDELCVRLRSARWLIWRLPDDMALHDAAMFHFRQWWRRTRRAGYAFAQGAHLHGASPERHFVWESRRAWIWGIIIPLSCIILTLVWPTFGWIPILVYPLQLLRLARREQGSVRDRIRLATFHVLSRFPEGLGQLAFLRDRLLRNRPRLIEHKRAP